MRMIDRIETGKRISEYREMCEMTQEELAAKIGADKVIVDKSEQGLSLTGVEIFLNIAEALGAYADDLIVWMDEKEE